MRNLDLIGLPESGKSTFLVALWFLLRRGHADDCRWGAVLDEFDSKYLDGLLARWLAYEEIGRTLRELDTAIDIRMKSRINAISLDLRIPDVPGDRFQDIWINRTGWTLGMEADGYLVFLNPSEAPVPTLVDVMVDEQADAIIGHLTDQPAEAAASSISEEEPFVWAPRNDPPQIQITYVLQELEASRAAAGLGKIPLAVLVSAWDRIPALLAGCTDPERVVSEQYPLLHGYLSVCDAFDLRFFGVSAQGGDCADLPLQRANKFDHLDRLTITDGTKISRDLSLAFDWMLG